MPNLQNPYKNLAYDYQPLSDQAWKQQEDLARESTRSYLGSHGLAANSPLGASLNARSQDRLASARANSDITNKMNYTNTMANLYSRPGATSPTGGEMALSGGAKLLGSLGERASGDIWEGAKSGAKWLGDKFGGGMSASTPISNPYAGMGGYGYGDVSYSEMPGMNAYAGMTPQTGQDLSGAFQPDYGGMAGAGMDTVSQGADMYSGMTGATAQDISGAFQPDYMSWWDQLLAGDGTQVWGY